MRLRLSGLIAATFTPMTSDGSLNLDGIPALVEHLVQAGLSGLYVNGSTGEGVSLTSAERRATTEAFVAAAAGRVRVIVQVGHNSLADARELAAHAAGAGADAISATPPSYFKPSTLDVLIDCLAEVTSGAPGLPFYYYNIPQMTGVSFDMVELLARGGERLPSLAGIKYTAPTVYELQACVEQFGDRYDLLFGSDEMLLAGLTAGAHGAVGSTYNFAAPLYRRLMEAFERGDVAAARALQGESVALVRAILRQRALPAQKAVMRLIGIDCGPTRLPLVPLNAAEFEQLREDLSAVGFPQH